MAHVATYVYGYDDYLALIRARRALGRFGRYSLAARYLFVGLVFLVVLAALTEWGNVSTADLMQPKVVAMIIGGLVGVALLVALIDLVFERFVYRLIFRRFALAGSEITVGLNENGVDWSGKGISASSEWSRVKRVYVGPDCVFLFFSGIEAIVLPRRAFASDAAFRETVAYAEARAGRANLAARP